MHRILGDVVEPSEARIILVPANERSYSRRSHAKHAREVSTSGHDSTSSDNQLLSERQGRLLKRNKAAPSSSKAPPSEAPVLDTATSKAAPAESSSSDIQIVDQDLNHPFGTTGPSSNPIPPDAANIVDPSFVAPSNAPQFASTHAGDDVPPESSWDGHPKEGDDFVQAPIPQATVHVPHWNVKCSSELVSPSDCRDFVDHIPPPGVASLVRHMPDKELSSRFNVVFSQLCGLLPAVRGRWESSVSRNEDLLVRMKEMEGVIKNQAQALSYQENQLSQKDVEASQLDLELRHLSAAHVSDQEMLRKLRAEGPSTQAFEKMQLDHQIAVSNYEADLKAARESNERLTAKLQEMRCLAQTGSPSSMPMVDQMWMTDKVEYQKEIKMLKEANQKLQEEKMMFVTEGMPLLYNKIKRGKEYLRILRKMIAANSASSLHDGLKLGFRSQAMGATLEDMNEYAPEAAAEFERASIDFSKFQPSVFHHLSSLGNPSLDMIRSIDIDVLPPVAVSQSSTGVAMGASPP